jgi:CGNR zinc finger/Putative stress-induced transcription regulator
MPVTTRWRNHLPCYTGYVSAIKELVRLDVCGDPADVIVAFLNTLDVQEGTDAIDTLDGWVSWLCDQGLDGCFGQQEGVDLERARELRGDLRALVRGEPVQDGQIRLGLTADGHVGLSSPTTYGFLGAAAATVAIQQRFDRLKICPADNCRWAFYDTSRNRSRQWCSMKVCGNRAKARAHRQRSSSP